jgi:aminoglycoside phosphotransferase (APT) family kinase protein
MSSAAPLPSTVGDLDAAWLTSVLRADGTIAGDAEIAEVRAERIALETGFSSELYRLHLTGEDGVPASVVAKLPTTTVVREAIDGIGGYARELAFYDQVAATAPLRTPRAHLAQMAADSTDFVLVLEDLRGWENGDHYAGLPLDRARACIAELAGLHAWSMHNGAIAEAFPSLDTPIARQAFPALFAEGWKVYREHARAPMPPAIARHAARFGEHAAVALEALTKRQMLIHGDIRADNLFFAGDQIAVVDFQLAARATGIVDVAYLVSQGLTTQERGGRDEQLVREYLEVLGVGDYDFEKAWRHYRLAVAFFLVFPLVAIRGWEALPERSRELCLRLIERSIATIEEIDALAVFA